MSGAKSRKWVHPKPTNQRNFINISDINMAAPMTLVCQTTFSVVAPL